MSENAQDVPSCSGPEYDGCVRSVRYVVLPCHDIAASRVFYEQVIGLRPDFSDGDRWTQYTLGGRRICLASPEELCRPSAGPVMVFEAAGSIGHLREYLAAREIRIIEQRDMGTHGTTLAVQDPAGNIIYFFAKITAGRD